MIDPCLVSVCLFFFNIGHFSEDFLFFDLVLEDYLQFIKLFLPIFWSFLVWYSYLTTVLSFIHGSKCYKVRLTCSCTSVPSSFLLLESWISHCWWDQLSFWFFLSVNCKTGRLWNDAHTCRSNHCQLEVSICRALSRFPSTLASHRVRQPGSEKLGKSNHKMNLGPVFEDWIG